MTQLSHKMSDNQSIKTPASNRSNELITLFATVIALQLSPLQAQTTESTRLLERWESPRSVLVKKDAVHTDTKPGANGTTWTVRSSVEASSPSATLQATKGYWQMVNLNWENLPVAEASRKLNEMTPEEKKKAIDMMDDTSAEVYEKYLDTTKIAVIKEWEKIDNWTQAVIKEWEKIDNWTQAVIKEWEKIDNWTQAVIENNNRKIETQKAAIKERDRLEAELIIEKKEWKRLEGELIKTYYAYVANIEAWASGERAVLEKMLKKEFTPTDLKERIESLLSRKDLRLALR